MNLIYEYKPFQQQRIFYGDHSFSERATKHCCDNYKWQYECKMPSMHVCLKPLRYFAHFEPIEYHRIACKEHVNALPIFQSNELSYTQYTKENTNIHDFLFIVWQYIIVWNIIGKPLKSKFRWALLLGVSKWFIAFELLHTKRTCLNKMFRISHVVCLFFIDIATKFQCQLVAAILAIKPFYKIWFICI